MSTDNIKVLAKAVADHTIKEMLNISGYIHRESLLDTMEAARFLGLDVENNKPESIRVQMAKFHKKENFKFPLKRVKLSGNRYRVQDLQEFIKNNTV